MKLPHSAIHFNGSSVACIIIQKPPRLFLDDTLNSSHHVKEKLPQAMKGFNFSKKFSNGLLRHSLATIYRSFVRSNLD